MLGDSSYDKVNQTYELTDKNDVRLTTRELDSTAANDDFQPMLNEHDATQSNQLPIAQWPHQPGTLVEDPRWELLYDLYDSFLMIVAIVLIMKTSLCIYAWNKDKSFSGKQLDAVSSLTLNLIQFNEQVVTAFTIIFVTIMTTVTRRYALYQAQQGAYITDLEQLQASISLPSTIKMVFSLRKFTKFSVSLVLLWSFYYLGSQASKREYAYAISDSFRVMSAAYPATTMTQYFDYFTGNYTIYRDQLNRDFLTILFNPGVDNPKLPTYGIDDKNNILLPDPSLLYMLYPNGTVNNTRVFKIRPSNTTYSTFVGRPLWTMAEDSYMNENGTSETYKYWSDPRIVGDYSLHTSYIKFQCLSLDVFSVDRFPANVPGTRVVSLNTTQSSSTQGANSTSSRQLEFWQRWYANTTIYGYSNSSDTSGTVVAPRINGSDGGAIRITCDIFEPQINIDVHCTETACLVTRMSCPLVDSTTLRANIFSNATFADSFFDNMLSAEAAPRTTDRDDWGDVTNYLRVYDDLIVAVGTGTLNSSIEQGALDDETRWLEATVNTYLNLAESLITPPDEDAASAGFELTEVLGAPWDPHYAVFWEWIAIDYLSSFLLLAAAMFSFWLRKHTLVPDIFGFVSSLTRDNPHFPVPPGASTLDGIERSRALRHVKVKVGDIGGPDGEVGRIGLSLYTRQYLQKG